MAVAVVVAAVVVGAAYFFLMFRVRQLPVELRWGGLLAFCMQAERERVVVGGSRSNSRGPVVFVRATAAAQSVAALEVVIRTRSNFVRV